MFDFRQLREKRSPSSTVSRRVVLLAGMAIVAASMVALGLLLDGPDRVPQQIARKSQTAGTQPSKSEPTNQQAIKANEATFPGVRSDYLDKVRDDTVFRADEADAWFHLLEILRNTSEAELEQATLGQVGYLQLDAQAPSYRGRVITVAGIVRKAIRIAAPENGYAITHYYQLWVQPERSAPELLVLYVLQLPTGFPQGEDLSADVTATGFFFKRWAYASLDGIRTVPLVLARTVHWKPALPVESDAVVTEQFFGAALIALLVAVVTTLFVLTRQRRRHAQPSSGPTFSIELLDPAGHIDRAGHDDDGSRLLPDDGESQP